jgi:hypothetical protein
MDVSVGGKENGTLNQTLEIIPATCCGSSDEQGLSARGTSLSDAGSV